ncbi:hypothetical protein TrCOL_g485 [Triparma columacea]|uniref:Uncharacterized protein n=1 Tax=Triparma columacea TaxID=722753 RepID=A0A9W7LBH8_9STRA|nr:hypothetical protein TrCOL_g485 [Triparma columacea]
MTTSSINAVSAFFGESAEDILAPTVSSNVLGTATLNRGKRGGVGSVKKTEQMGIGKDLLKIGIRKRGRGEDVEVEDGGDSEDEDGGVWGEKLKAIETRGERPEMVRVGGGEGGEVGEGKKKKKKLGKKEREKMKLEGGVGGGEVDGEEDAAVGDTAEDAAGSPNPNRKKKRKKVRSRQKNIRKDKRVLDGTLPEHLVQKAGKGSKARPMTAETKKRLGLDKKKEARREVVNDLDDEAKEKARLKKARAMQMVGGFRNLKK